MSNPLNTNLKGKPEFNFEVVMLFALMLIGIVGSGLGLFEQEEKWINPLCTGSMMPYIDCHHEYKAVPYNNENLSIGEIIIFKTDWSEPALVMHRINEVFNPMFTDTVYVTKGDANSKVDPEFVKKEDIKYVVTQPLEKRHMCEVD